jgi:hypothetical protein
MFTNNRHIHKIAILTRSDYKSPRILAESLKLQIEQSSAEATIFFDIELLTRLVSYMDSKLSFHFWLWKKVSRYFSDRKILKQLKRFDAIVISECIPNGFWKRLYNIEKLKTIIKKPVFLYEVYFLGNSPTQIEDLKKAGDSLFERYDAHLSITEVTEIKTKPRDKYFCIGLNLTATGLKPTPKNEFIALVDFQQSGYEYVQVEQLAVLAELNIKTIVLTGKYSIQEIRKLYREASVFFIQFPEAFGLPIAECLACGVQIFTPNSGWAMSWRLDENPGIHEKGELPECFTIYDSKADLAEKLAKFKNYYDLSKTPQKVFDHFIKNYPTYYSGNKNVIQQLLDAIQESQNGKQGNFSIK